MLDFTALVAMIVKTLHQQLVQKVTTVRKDPQIRLIARLANIKMRFNKDRVRLVALDTFAQQVRFELSTKSASWSVQKAGIVQMEQNLAQSLDALRELMATLLEHGKRSNVCSVQLGNTVEVQVPNGQATV